MDADACKSFFTETYAALEIFRLMYPTEWRQSLTGDTLLRITGAGRDEFRTLITSPVRGQMTDLSRLVVALKLRFLAALATDERRAEIEQLLSASEQDLARLRDLAVQHGAAEDLLGDWLAQDIAQTERRIAWYRARIDLV